MGIPPATLASMATLVPALMAHSQISAPRSAINSLFAVTTDFLAAMAAWMTSTATVVPPTSSTTISTPGCSINRRQSLVLKTGPSDSGIAGAGFQDQIGRAHV